MGFNWRVDVMSEKEFNDWLESIEFVDADGKVVEIELEDDNSEGEEEE